MVTAVLQTNQRNDPAATWTTNDPILFLGEIGYESDTGRFKWGDGISVWSVLTYNDATEVAHIADSTIHYLQSAINITLSQVSDNGVLAALNTVSSTEIDNSAITFAKMQDIPTANLLGRITAATGVVEDLTGTQATTLLNVFTSGLKGLVPASGGSASEFLSADGTFKVSAGGAVDSVFGRTGAVVAIQADYDSFFLTPTEGNAAYLAIAAKAADSELLDGVDGSNYARTNIAETFDGNVNIDGSTGLIIGIQGSAGKLQLNATDGVNEGGEMIIVGAASHADWNIDNNSANLRLFSGGTIYFQQSVTKTLIEKELEVLGRINKVGTALVSGDFSLSGRWGDTASIGSILGNDQRFSFIVTSAGTGQLANASIILTFTDGAWTVVPIGVPGRRSGAQPAIPFHITTTTTTLTLNFPGLPVAGQTYGVNVIVIG